MLITEEAESRISKILATIAGSYSIYMIGKDLGQTTFQAAGSALTSRRLTFLEQSFLAGRIAADLGTDRLRTMSQSDITDWITTNNVSLNDTETATLRTLRRDTERWLQGRSEAWQQRFRSAISTADKEWRGQVSAGSFRDAQARTLARNESLNELIQALRGHNESFRGDIDRLVQTEMNTYFQQGQMVSVSGGEYVYKIPRASACAHCLRLHLKSDGSPKVYKLSEVMGNSNWGKKAGSWKFTVGSTHPFCYCILYRVKDKPAPGPDSRLGQARRSTLHKATFIPHLTDNKCAISGSPETLFEDVLQKSDSAENPPEHQMLLIATLLELYGDSLPVLRKD